MLFGEGVDCPHTTLSKERSLIEREIPSRAGDRLLNIRASSLSDSNGRVRGFLHSIKVTRERVLERQLIEAGRLSLAAMTASSVAHEVATPLSVIANIAEMLMMDCERDSATATSLRKIVSQARRVADMMREILNFIRERPVNFGAIDMSALVRETLDLIEYQLTESHIQVSVECSMDTSLIWGDRAQLRQVLLSVIATASQAMKNGGLLRVRICEGAVLNMPRPSVLITVEDTGRGMLAPAIERVFDNSFTTKTAEGGRNLAWLSRSE
jgi:C4-dicarboxylate-specific signal transduction histidine kinase